jgi:hypothetical protein
MTIESLIGGIPKFIDSVLVPLVFALAFITFLWGVYTYFIAGAASDEQRETGRKFVMWSVIAFVVMLSLGGIIMVLQNSLGLTSGTRTCLPSITGDCKKQEQTNDGNPFDGKTPETSFCVNDSNCSNEYGSSYGCGASGVCEKKSNSSAKPGQGQACNPSASAPCAGSLTCTEIGAYDGTEFICL